MSVAAVQVSDWVHRAVNPTGAAKMGSGPNVAPGFAAQLRRAATEFVSQALVLPVFESFRHSPLASDGPFAPGTAEKRFMPLLDQHLADRVTTAGNFALVDAIVARFQTQTGTGKLPLPLGEGWGEGAHELQGDPYTPSPQTPLPEGEGNWPSLFADQEDDHAR